MWGSSITISGDGRRLAAMGAGPKGDLIWVREAEDANWRALEGTEGSWRPELSTNGRFVKYRSNNDNNVPSSWARVPFEGGATVPVEEGVLRASPWVELANGGVLHCRSWRQQEGLSVPSLWLEYFESRESAEFVESLESTEPGVRLLDDACEIRRVGDRILFVRSKELWAIRLGEDELPKGEAVPLGIRPFSSDFQAPPHYDVSSNGTLVYLDETPDSDLWRVSESGRLLEMIPLDQPVAGGNPVHLRTSPNGENAVVIAQREARIVRLRSGRRFRPVPADSAIWRDNQTLVTHLRTEAITVLDSRAQVLSQVSPARLTGAPWHVKCRGPGDRLGSVLVVVECGWLPLTSECACNRRP